jgi:hypothetical protein
VIERSSLVYKKTLNPRFVLAVSLCMLLAMTSGCLWAESTFKALPESQIDKAQRDAADRMATKLLTAWTNGRFEPLPDDFSSIMQEALKPAEQKKSWLTLVAMFGGFEKLDFVEAAASDELPNMILYRFKGTFADTPKKPEVRVVIKKTDGKCWGFWVKPWKDRVQ